MEARLERDLAGAFQQGPRLPLAPPIESRGPERVERLDGVLGETEPLRGGVRTVRDRDERS